MDSRFKLLRRALPGHAVSQTDEEPRAARRIAWLGPGRRPRSPGDTFVDDPSRILSDVLPQLPHEPIGLVDPFTCQLREACTGLPIQLTHGDCNDGNVLLDRPRITGE